MDSFPNWSLMENCFTLSVPAGFLYRDLRAASGLTLIFSLSFAEFPDTPSWPLPGWLPASIPLPASGITFIIGTDLKVYLKDSHAAPG